MTHFSHKTLEISKKIYKMNFLKISVLQIITTKYFNIKRLKYWINSPLKKLFIPQTILGRIKFIFEKIVLFIAGYSPEVQSPKSRPYYTCQ